MTTIIKQVEELLKENWYSAFQLNNAVKSSSGDREMRRLRQNLPDGYTMIQRVKLIDGYRRCNEYKLHKVD